MKQVLFCNIIRLIFMLLKENIIKLNINNKILYFILFCKITLTFEKKFNCFIIIK